MMLIKMNGLIEFKVTTYCCMMNECKKNGVVLMDGTMYMHHARTQLLQEVLSSSNCGQVSRVECNFSFPGDESFFANNIRTKASADPLGVLGDLGEINMNK